MNQLARKQTTKQHLSDLLSHLTIFAIAFGILVRLVQYLSNHSLWRDEASLALNLVHRSYLELLQPLDHNQAAPPGFLSIYVDSRGSPDQLKYYLERYGFAPADYVFGYGDFLNPAQFSERGWQEFKQSSTPLHNKRRVWFIFTGLGPLDASFAKPHLDRIGQELDYFKQPGAFTHIYQLNGLSN